MLLHNASLEQTSRAAHHYFGIGLRGSFLA
jgi:hypothetical protein